MMYYDKDFWEGLSETKPITPPLEPYQQTLLEAAHYIREHGWCQHTRETPGGSVCLLGALDKVARHSGYAAAVDRLAFYLSICLEGDTLRIADWNDFKCKSEEQAIQTLGDCALKGR